MWQDPIVSETRALRDEYAQQFNYNIGAMCKDLMAQQATDPERVVSFPLRKPAVSVVVPQQGTPVDRFASASPQKNGG